MNLANTIKSMYESKQDFEPHMMYDPETGKGYKAEKPEDHERMKKMGYTHEKPEAKDEKDLDEAFEKSLEEAKYPKAARGKASVGYPHAPRGMRWKTLIPMRGKTTIVNYHQAVKDYGKDNVHYTKGGMKNGEDHVQVLLPESTHHEGLNENLVMKAQFKVGDMPNSDLHTSIEKLKTAKKKADAQKSKVSDPVLVKSLDDVISEIDKTIKDAEKVQAAASKAIAKVAPSIKRTFELINRKKYLIQSAEVEGDVIEEGMGAFPQVGGKFALKKTHVKMIQDIIDSKGNAAASHIQSKMGYSKSAAQDLIDLAKGRAIYGKKLGMTGSGVVEEVELDEAYQQFTDKTANWGEGQAVAFGRKKGYKEVAVMSDNNSKHPMVLFALDSGDKKYIKGSNVKSGETVFRYATKISIAGDIFPLVKVNIAKGIYYNLTQESSEGTIEDAKFETKGVKLKFFRSLEGAIKESVELDEAKFGDNDLVHIAKANVRGNNNPKTDKIIGYSKAPKNPNKFPDPKSGANAIMRIADAKKKGFKVESAELNEDYFMVQYYDKKGKADTTKFSKFDNEQKAKKYLDRANKAEKEGEYKMFKVKGKMESTEMNESNENFFGTAKNHGISDSLLDAVNAVVTGQAETVEVESEPVQEPEQIDEDNTNNKSDDGEGLDKVQPKAVKKKFKDRKDKDIDNDGDVDSSDKFLHKKRKAISKAIDKDDSEEKNVDKEEDKKGVKSGKKEKVDLKPKLDEATFKSKYGSRWESVMEATIKRLAEQQELNEKFTLLKDKDIAPLVLALKDNISVELKDPKNNNLLVTMQTTDDGVQVKYKTGRNTKVGTEKSPMPAIKSAVKFLKAKELAFREL